jgi:hypothetical protein
MTSLKLLLTTIAAVVVSASAGAPIAMPAPTPGLADGLPTPVCTPSWGTIVLPICV